MPHRFLGFLLGGGVLLVVLAVAAGYYAEGALQRGELPRTAPAPIVLAEEVSALDSGGRNNVQYIGRTVTTYTGNLGGIAGANAKCNAVGGTYAGSHMCTQGEALRSGATSFGGAGWIACDIYAVIPGPPGFESVGCNTRTRSIFTAGATNDVRSCLQWTSASISQWGPQMSSTGAVSEQTCNNSLSIHCCK